MGCIRPVLFIFVRILPEKYEKYSIYTLLFLLVTGCCRANRRHRIYLSPLSFFGKSQCDGRQYDVLGRRDPSLIFHNPALLGAEMDQMVNLNYLNYISDINVGSALFTKAYKEKGAWGVGASFFSQGKIRGMSEEGLPTGDFTAKDISVNGFFSYDLSERWRGGASLKFLYSGIGDYTSIGVAVDAGLSYYDSEKGFSFGFAFKNIGAQLKAYEDGVRKCLGISNWGSPSRWLMRLSACR